jgi:hypothetical protein
MAQRTKLSQCKKEDCMSKKILSVLIGVLMVCTFITMCLAEEKETARQDQIKKAQEDLATLGMYKGEADGKMNKDTREAIKEFQKKEMDMKVPSGILNEKTCDEIAKMAEKEMQGDKGGIKGGMEKGKSKMDEGMGKVKEGMDMTK